LTELQSFNNDSSLITEDQYKSIDDEDPGRKVSINETSDNNA